MELPSSPNKHMKRPYSWRMGKRAFFLMKGEHLELPTHVPLFSWYFFQAIRHVQTMYEEAYNDYLRDKEKGNGTLITFHSTVSDFFLQISSSKDYWVTDLMDVSLSKLRETVKDREAWHAAVHGVTNSWTWLSDWTATNIMHKLGSLIT